MLEMSEWTSNIALTDRWDRAAAVLRARSSRELIAAVVVIVFVASLSLGLWYSGLFAVPSLVVPVTPLSQQLPPAPVPEPVPTSNNTSASIPSSIATIITAKPMTTAVTETSSTTITTFKGRTVPTSFCTGWTYAGLGVVGFVACQIACSNTNTCALSAFCAVLVTISHPILTVLLTSQYNHHKKKSIISMLILPKFPILRR